MTDELLAIADDLYALPLGDFTPARDAKAKELKGTDLAAPVKGLKKPSLAAWVVNLLVRRDAEQVDQVLELGAALRDAAAGMDGDELRNLTRQRRQLTAAVTTGARALAASSGVKVTQAVADQVEATLTAAMVDARCADAVRSGLLVTALASTGVDEVDLERGRGHAGGAGVHRQPGRPRTAGPARRTRPGRRREGGGCRPRAGRGGGRGPGLARRMRCRQPAARSTELEARTLQLQAEIDEVRRKLAELESAYGGGRRGAVGRGGRAVRGGSVGGRRVEGASGSRSRRSPSSRGDASR